MKQEILSFFYSKSKYQTILFILCVVVFALICISFIPIGKNSRKIFFFANQQTGRIESEIRSIPNQKKEFALEQFINELLLGPTKPNLMPLVPTETVLESSFIRNGSAYLSFSSHIVENSLNGVDFTQTMALFKKNVCTNFRNVARIYLYIDGKEVYELDYFNNVVLKK